METGVVEDRNQVIQELFSGLHRVNRKAKMVLELLGFRSAAALPEHLHAAVLQVLLMGPVVGPFCRRSLLPLETRGAAAEPLPLRSEGCVIQCLFADWLTKTSKWLKVPRYRYVMLLSVAPTPEQEEGRQPITRNNSTSKPTASVAEEIPQAQGEQTEFAGLKQKKRHCPQLLLVTFKAPQGPLSNSGHESVDFNVLQKAEPSEVFSIDSTHVSSIMLHLQDYRTLPAQVTVLGKAFTGVPTSITYIGVHLHVCASVAFQRALCQRIPCGEDTQLVLVVEGLGGRLLILGEFSRSAASLSVREYRRKVALVQHEYQMSRQHASRALMDEHGQLFPQARRWLDSTDGKLLMLCLTGRSWRPTAGPRS
ncbi:uncharacterized protein EMH_0046470 [Eimeria mitis]|uniref:Uncharacterized protein n=1 Tax=Eimeria mitis TaxID=44415 RepID=U6KE57_9EIME|nr:uncharacterized protein EMH_0046470 [Eimeria mitis]CDJ36305.1 hypothetical protein, conserved [Eimeria mitis]